MLRQPGKWFNYACIDRTVPDWDTLTTRSFGINPNRVIDPIIATKLPLTVAF